MHTKIAHEIRDEYLIKYPFAGTRFLKKINISKQQCHNILKILCDGFDNFAFILKLNQSEQNINTIISQKALLFLQPKQPFEALLPSPNTPYTDKKNKKH